MQAKILRRGGTIREAIDSLLRERRRRSSVEEGLVASFGAWAGRDDIPGGSEYVRQIREEEEKKLRQFGI
jgi:hypothetical protein